MEEKTMMHEWLCDIATTLETLAEQVKGLAYAIDLDNDAESEGEGGITDEEMQTALRLLKHCPYRDDNNACKRMHMSCHDVLKREQCVRLVEVCEEES